MASPGAPNIQLNPQATLNSLSFYWNEPSNIGAGPITNYILLNQNTIVSTILGPSTYNIQISSLTNTIDYNFQLAAINDYGQGPYINFMTAQPGTLAAGLTNVNSQVVGINAIAVNWNYVTNLNESTAEAFAITATAPVSSFSSIQTMAYPNQSSILISNLPVNTTSTIYTATVQVINDAGWSLPILSNSNISTRTLALWLDGNDIDYSGISPRDGFRITRWIDKSGNGRHAISPSGNPIVRASNQKNLFAAFFNGSSNLTVTYTNFPRVYTVFTVQYLSVNNASFQRVVDNDQRLFVGVLGPNVATFTGNGSWSDTNANTPNINNFQAWCLVSMVVNNTTLNPFVNGTAQNAKTTTTALFNNLFIGGSQQQWNGYIGEILIYNNVLNTAQRQQVEGYLAVKWNLKRNLPVVHPNYVINPTSVMLPWVPAPLPTAPFIRSFTNITSNGFTVTWNGGTYATSYTFTLGGNSVTPVSQTINSATFSGLTANTGYVVQITAINASGSVLSLNAGPTGSFLWLDASDATTITFSSSNLVNRWSDKSGNSNHMTQSVVGNQPTLTSSFRNGLSAMNMGASGFFGNTTMTFGPPPYSIFAVAVNSGSAYQYIIGSPNDGRIFFGTNTNNFTTFVGNGSWNELNANTPLRSVLSLSLLGLTNQGTNTTLIPYFNGVPLDAKNGTATVTTGLYIGCSNGQNQFWNGTICEVIIFNSALSEFDRQSIEGYLAWKWGLQTSLPSTHLYYSASPQSSTLITGPTQPTALSSSSVTNNAFTVNWSSVTGATSYTYTLNGILVTPTTSTSTSATFTNQLVGTNYTVIVTAVSASGSTPSAPIVITTLGPSQPTNPQVTGMTTTGFTLIWSGGSGATSYNYLLNNIPIIPSTDNGVSTNSAIFTTLNSGTNFTIVVQAVSSGYTNSSSQITTNTLGPSNPNALWQTASSATGFTVNWLGGLGASSYTYTINGVTTTPLVNNGVRHNSAVFTGLTIGNVYQVVVTAINASGSASSVVTNFYTTPTAPS